MEEFLKNFALFPRDVVAIPAMALLFVGFWRVFGASVISRHLALYEARERASVGARQGAEENLMAAAKLTKDFENKLSAELVAISKTLEPKITQARSEASRIIESAEAEAATLIESTRTSIAEEQIRLSRDRKSVV